ncbi:uncharacterized protein LOC104563469 isoform X1 [Colius striatus]|uniref:uncharacterized protein LOC104563469 isoform X1 n=1 Tax=Colius striatus TaxID=57412 RepID=UPI002B1E6C0F|nr:uncharacterized protein LOC104563469 isoform X1 [Colius striatus]XP_061868931.1 uncharacterized protein LOC104563469 isoform X1 [Colius striatus]XP_061868932.1 uncharacterized protein LOC104563469 isoform X1 [Colius striatus]XP_061868933.1 uncharacterized protein LOC104563469 isoform X1 [Colius striatus]XP_061868934.1 uncharacterized protein LOC104563469 isoform X1 [Colius striatus]XP_061868935.1 uncharacterized protein LOC104563469 isoform X1 [Colius striatus]
MKVLLLLAVLLTCSVFTARGKFPRKYAPGLEGSTVGNLTAHGCPPLWGSSGASRASMDRDWDLVPARCLQMRAGSPALQDAQPGAAPAAQQVLGTSWEVLKHKGFLQNHLQAEKRKDGAVPGAFPNPGGSPPRGFFGFGVRTTILS